MESLFWTAVVALGISCAFGISYLLWRVLTLRARRRSLERMVAGQLAAVVRLDLPLAEALRMAAEGEPRRVRARLLAISALLSRGSSLSAAVQAGYPECSGVVLSMIEAGERSGQLKSAVHEAERMLVDRDRAGEHVDPAVGPYTVFVLAFMLGICTMVMVVVIPKFEEIFADFDTELPWLTQTLISISAGMGQMFALLLMLLVLAIPLVIYWRVRPRRPGALQWTAHLADTVRWRVPGLRRMQMGTGMAVIFRVLGFASRAGMPLAQAADTAADLDVNVHLRSRIRDFSRRLSAGEGAGDAARRAGLGNVATVALASGQRAGNFDTALRYVADYHTSLISRSWLVMQQVVWPVCTLVLATMVGIIVFALFSPLISLIEAVMG